LLEQTLAQAKAKSKYIRSSYDAHCHIAIIGAGWTGLQSAALFCNKYGCDVVIFEEKSSMGGTWAENAAYTELKTHTPALTTEFIGYPYPKDLVPNNRRRVTQPVVEKYVRLYANDTGLAEKIHFNAKVTCIDQISDDLVEITIQNKQTGGESKERFDYVYNTGFGSEPRKPPTYPGSQVFQGDVLTSHDVDEAAIDKMKQSGQTVVVLGGSKASIDMLVLLHNAGVPTRWIARRVYWFFQCYRGGYDERVDKLASFPMRLWVTLGQLVAAVSLSAMINMTKSVGALANPHPEASDSTAFHYGNIDADMLAIAKAVPFKQGEIRELTSDGLITMKGDVVKCSTIIAAFGTDPVPLFPEFRRGGKVVDVLNTPHIYQMAIHPQLPRVYFTGPIPLKCFGMLNGYHSTQHAIILWAKQLSVEELTKRTAKEEKIVRRSLKKFGFTPLFKRSVTDVGNFVKYMSVVDKLYNKAGYTKPLNLGLAKFTWIAYLHGRQNTVIHRNPSKQEAIKALGSRNIVKGHGLVPRTDKLVAKAM
jgi:thioredoxin reductase